MSQLNKSAVESNRTNQLSVDLEQITAVLAQDPESLDESSLKELVWALENAYGIAGGVESKLDGIIEALDDLLGSLEKDKKSEGGAENEDIPGQNGKTGKS